MVHPPVHRPPLVSLAFGLTTALLTLSASGQPLNDEIQDLLSKTKLGSDRAGISVVRLGSGTSADTVLASFNADKTFTPASNQKVLTTASALWVLGPDFVFRTEFQISGETLIIKGSGDPSFADPEMLTKYGGGMTVPQLLSAVVSAIKKGGVRHLSQIVCDDRVFDRVYLHTAWASRHLDKPYGAEVSGINFHANVLSVFPSPAKQSSAPPTFKIEPDVAFLEIQNLAKTGGKENSVGLERYADDNRFRLRGQVAQPTLEPIESPLHNTALFAGMTLAEALEKEGVSIGTPTGTTGARAVRLAMGQESFESPKTLAVVTTPLIDVIKRCNTDSMNLYAEALLKRVGYEVTKEPGSWENGAAVIRMTLSQKLGPARAAGTIISDGSGLADSNRVSPSTITTWLDAAASDKAIAPAFLDSLATTARGGLRQRFGTGTLRHKLQAKTGYIHAVSCLSGYVSDEKTNERIAFSILTNDVTGDRLTAARELQEAIVKLIDSHLTKTNARTTGSARADE